MRILMRLMRYTFFSVLFILTLISENSVAATRDVESYLIGLRSQLEAHKTLVEFVRTSDHLPRFYREEILAWLGRQKLANVRLRSVEVRVTDLLLVDGQGRRAQLTFTDLKRGVVHINGKLATYDSALSVATNLDRYVVLASGRKMAVYLQGLLVPQVEASTAIWGVAATVAVVTLSSGVSWGFVNSAASIKMSLEDIVKIADFTPSLQLDCGARFKSFGPEQKGVRLDLKRKDNSVVTYLASRESGAYRVIPEVNRSPDGLAEADRRRLLQQARDCCDRPDCERFINGDVQGDTQKPSQFAPLRAPK